MTEIADAHVHFFSPAFFRSLAEQKKAAEVNSLLGWDLPDSSEALADRWVGEMDRNNVRQAMLIASIPGDTASVEAAVARHPGRFGAVSMVNPLAPNASVNVPKGIFLFPAMHRYSLHDERARAVIAKARVVYVHCGVLSVGFRRKLGLPSPFDMRFSNPVDLHAIALEFPQVRFVIPHFGAGYFREALMVADLCPNVYLDTSSSNSWLRYQPGNMTLADVFRSALEVAGPKRILFGSDSSWFPRGWVAAIRETQEKALAEAGADPETAHAIFGGNLRALLNTLRSE
ncbi:MAG TPA: amidohydrolase family protein [Bryobacteraceae bacterium]|nr:amidohydrolase family protein [Bryobacteraceae bacterium]